MTTKPKFVKSLMRGYLMMLNCSTKRSIISSVARIASKPDTEYENKKWKIKYLQDNDYRVTSKDDGTDYLVKIFGDIAYGWTYGVYKRKRLR